MPQIALLVLTFLLIWTPTNGQAAPYRGSPVIKAEYQTQVQEPPTPRAEFRVARDSWWGQDKLVDHFFGAFALAVIADRATHAETQDAETRVFLWTGAFWLGNEVKDGLAPWEKVGWIGGDGFSTKDLLWSLAGTGLALIIF